MNGVSVFKVDNEVFHLIGCPVCESLPATDINCIWCGGAGNLKQIRLAEESCAEDPA